MAVGCFHAQANGIMVLKFPRSQVGKVMAMKSLLCLIRSLMAFHAQIIGTTVLKSPPSHVDRVIVMRSLLCLLKSLMAFHTQDSGSSMVQTSPRSQLDKVMVRRFQQCLTIGATEIRYLCILVRGAMMPRHVDYQATSKVLFVGTGSQETVLPMVLLVISKSR